MICIYHSRDLDGFTSGFIVKRKYPDAKLIGYDYGQPFPYEKIPSGEQVIMIDVSLKMPEMEVLAKHTGFNLIWIDHHASAIKEYNEFIGSGERFCNAILKDGQAACEGGWDYLFPNEQMPEAIRLLGEYDTWRNQDKDRWSERILPFQFGMRVYCNSPDTFPADVIGYGGMAVVNSIIKEGASILKYQAQINETLCKRAAFEMEFKGLRAICLNGGGFNSDVFKSVYNESKHDIMMPFQFDGRMWTISLYTTKPDIDCSVIAKSNGGGGHKQAASFQTQDISSLFPNIK